MYGKSPESVTLNVGKDTYGKPEIYYEVEPQLFLDFERGIQELMRRHPDTLNILSLLAKRLRAQTIFTQVKAVSSPNRDFEYQSLSSQDRDTIPTWLVFDLLTAFPSDELLYRTIRPWFFHPDADIRNHAFAASLRLHERWPVECGRDLDWCIDQDPYQQMQNWLSQYRLNQDDRHKRHLSSWVLRRPPEDRAVSLDSLRAYFNLGEYETAPFPVEIAERLRGDRVSELLNKFALAGLTAAEHAIANGGVVDPEQIKKLDQLEHELEMQELGERHVEYGPSFYHMVEQLWRLPVGEIAVALGNALERPHVFLQRLEDHSYWGTRIDEITRKLILATAFIHQPELAQNILFSILQWPRLAESTKILESLCKVAYALPIGVIDSELLPLVLGLDLSSHNNRQCLGWLLRSADPAIARDISGHELPLYGEASIL